jgi:DVNP family
MKHHKVHGMRAGHKASRIGSKRAVLAGKAMHTVGGLTAAHLMVNKRGKVVSAKKHAHGLRNFHHLRR